MPARDPRIDPLPGDRLVKGWHFRDVTAVEPGPGRVIFLDSRNGVTAESCFIANWRRWAKHAVAIIPEEVPDAPHR